MSDKWTGPLPQYGDPIQEAIIKVTYANRDVVERLIWTTLRPCPWWMPGWLWRALVRRMIEVRQQEIKK